MLRKACFAAQQAEITSNGVKIVRATVKEKIPWRGRKVGDNNDDEEAAAATKTTRVREILSCKIRSAPVAPVVRSM